MIDKNYIGKKLAPAVLDIEQGRLKFFCKVIGETNPIYFDVSAAKAAGYPSIPVPPTFLFAVELDANTIEQAFCEIGVEPQSILHGEQQFTYYAPIYAGDTITVQSMISDIYDKKNGALEFIVKDSVVTNQHGNHVADLRHITVVRNQ